MEKVGIGVIKSSIGVVFMLFGCALEVEGQGLVINEIMATASEGRADYVEVYNGGDAPVDAGELIVAYWTKSGRKRTARLCEGSYLLAAGGYVVATKDVEAVGRLFTVVDEGAVVECGKFPVLAKEGVVAIMDADSVVIDSVAYREGWHHPLQKEHRDVSLERIDVRGGSNDASNWTSALESAGYATPGGRNSVAREGEVSGVGRLRVSLGSEVICPRGDGVGLPSVLEVEVWSGGDVSGVSMSVYDGEGRLVARPVRNRAVGSGREVLVWDGRGEDGVVVGARSYVVVVEVWESGGGSGVRSGVVTVVE